MGPTATDMMKYFPWKLHDSWDLPGDYSGGEMEEARFPRCGEPPSWEMGVLTSLCNALYCYVHLEMPVT